LISLRVAPTAAATSAITARACNFIPALRASNEMPGVPEAAKIKSP
jgi:hypothetical protein